jgi:ATP-dependent Clp protease protease subunit
MKRTLPKARADRPASRLQWDLTQAALERWSPNLAAAAEGDNTISILDQIGQDFWTGEGVTAKRISAALRSIGAERDVVVNINSPGGDLFEGLAIYSLLREHKGEVTVKVLGLAASAASIVAMAGDTVQIARAGFLMIHNTWVVALGNRNDLRDIADQLEPFDSSMADIYAARTGMERKNVAKMMDAETWISGSDAVEKGFADALLPSDQVKESATSNERIAAHLLDLALAKAGMPRNERRALLQDYKTGTQNAAGAGTQNAARTDTQIAVEQEQELASHFGALVQQARSIL